MLSSKCMDSSSSLTFASFNADPSVYAHTAGRKYFPARSAPIVLNARRSKQSIRYVPVIMVVIGKHAVDPFAHKECCSPGEFFRCSGVLSRFAGHAANVLPLRQDYLLFAVSLRVSSGVRPSPMPMDTPGASEYKRPNVPRTIACSSGQENSQTQRVWFHGVGLNIFFHVVHHGVQMFSSRISLEGGLCLRCAGRCRR